MRKASNRMPAIRQVIRGLFTALVSLLLLFGGFTLSLAEGNLRPAIATLPATLPASVTPTVQVFPTETPPVDSPTPLLPTLTPTFTPTFPPTPTNCPPPLGWLPYYIQPGDTLSGLAQRYHLTTSRISQANCLLTTNLLPGMVIYLPPAPTRTPIPCGAPKTWVLYTVQPGDTLFHLGQLYGIPYTDLQRANCLTSSTIRTGQLLYVPPWPQRTPSPTLPGIPSLTSTPTGATETPLPTWTDVPTSTSIPTDTPTPEPSATQG